MDDRRLKRLEVVDREAYEGTSSGIDSAELTRERLRRHRQIAEPVILDEADEQSQSESVASVKQEIKEEVVEAVEIDEDERMRRRLELKKKALQRQEELMKAEEEQHHQTSQARGSADTESEDGSGEEESEYEEYSESDDESDEDTAPRLKPIFVRKSDRVTIIEKEQEEERERELEIEKERLAEEERKLTRKLVEEEIAREKMLDKENDDDVVCEFDTDDEKEAAGQEAEYEAWKLRELRRMKRDREDRERIQRERDEVLKLRNMTEEERREYEKANPKQVTNKAAKGKYKFLQKYYHRGAFFLDQDNEVFKRDFAQPTLEDHFDKSILPKVMQVKNFGMAGRTKYTHLLDQDTTRKEENPWDSAEKFAASGKGGGTKQVFEKPTAKKRK